MPSLWRLLNPDLPSSNLPPLLISTVFTINSYTVTLTDLTYIWSESLDRRSIIKRSLDEETSIDPSEDAQQLHVFLDKIQSALSGGEKTSLQLQATRKLKLDVPACLDLLVTALLPKGLESLKWPIHLTPSPQSTLSSQLLIPILKAQNARMREMRRLVEILREKDHVIQKLLDRLEATGTVLGNVFPGIAVKGGRKVSRKMAEERVRGLGLFDSEEWRKDMAKKEKESSSAEVGAVVQGVFAPHDGSAEDGAGMQEASEVPESWNQWWENAEQHPINLLSSTSAAVALNEMTMITKEAMTKEQSTTNDEDDDFQVQATPPQLAGSPAAVTDPASSPPTLQSQAPIEDSTEDEDDLDAPSQRSAVPDSFPLHPPPQQTKKLGIVGRPKPAPAALPNSPPKADPTILNLLTSRAPVQLPDTNVDDDDATASEDDEADKQHVHAPARKSSTPPRRQTASPGPAPALAPAKPKPKTLGQIGGSKPKKAPPPPVPTPVPAPSSPLSAHTISPITPKKARNKLGLIGHKPSHDSPSKSTAPHPAGVETEWRGRRGRDDDLRGDAGEAKTKGVGLSGGMVVENGEGEGEKRIRETSMEKADRKREELKRVLEEKARVPVKKKRKF